MLGCSAFLPAHQSTSQFTLSVGYPENRLPVVFESWWFWGPGWVARGLGVGTLAVHFFDHFSHRFLEATFSDLGWIWAPFGGRFLLHFHVLGYLFSSMFLDRFLIGF